MSATVIKHDGTIPPMNGAGTRPTLATNSIRCVVDTRPADLMKFLLAAPDDSKTEMFFHRVEVPIAVKQRVTVH